MVSLPASYGEEVVTQLEALGLACGIVGHIVEKAEKEIVVE